MGKSQFYIGLTPLWNSPSFKCIDPCAGSGHILAYMFDVLVQIYEDYGYSAREAVRGIIENNLYGLDIDERAAQLAYFAVMMKARQYDRRFFARKDENGNPDVPQPHVYVIVESNGIDRFALEYFINSDAVLKKAMDSIIREMQDAKEYGSILKITPVDFAALYARFDEVRDDIDLSKEIVLDCILPLVQVAETMAQKYDVTVTNPPYLSVSATGPKLNSYVLKNYPDSKADMFAVFVEQCKALLKPNGYQAMITMHTWMFIASFEQFRMKLMKSDYTGVLGKFLNYIDSTPIIIDFIKGCGECDWNLADEVNDVQASYGGMIFGTGDTEEEEIRNVYAVLHYLSDNNNSVYRGVAMGYSHSKNYQDKIKGFNDRFVMVLIRHIERYLTKVGIDMGIDEKITYNVTVENGQAIIATDGSTVNATNQVGTDGSELAKLIAAVQAATDSLAPEDKEAVQESLEVIEAEASAEKPKKSMLRTALSTLSAIKGIAEFGAAVAALAQFVSQFL